MLDFWQRISFRSYLSTYVGTLYLFKNEVYQIDGGDFFIVAFIENINFTERANFVINWGGEMGKISQKNHNNPWYSWKKWLANYLQEFFFLLNCARSIRTDWTVIPPLGAFIYRDSPVSAVFWSSVNRTIGKTALIGDWFSTKIVIWVFKVPFLARFSQNFSLI